MKSLLVIFAHPDDESFGPASGTLAKYASEGVAVNYLCATSGEAGTVSDLRGYATIADLRTAELIKAAGEIGLASVNFLGFRDSGMTGSTDNQHPESLFTAALDEVAARIASHIQRINPDAIITHDQYGWYGHPDHIKCYQATLRAYQILYGTTFDDRGNIVPSSFVNSHAPRLYVSTFPKWLLKLTVRLMPLMGRDPRRHGQNQDVDLVEIASWRVSETARVSVGDYANTKERAAACHASQCPLTDSKHNLFKAVLRGFQRVETFSRLYPSVAAREPMETSLFAADIKQPQYMPAPAIGRI